MHTIEIIALFDHGTTRMDKRNMRQYLGLTILLLCSQFAFGFTIRVSAWVKPFSRRHCTQKALSKHDGDVDMDSQLVTSSFPIKPDELVSLAKEILFSKGVGTKDEGACLADNFFFRVSAVEKDKQEYLRALDMFNFEEAFAIQQNCFGWTVDPFQPNRVWVFCRQTAKHERGPFMGVQPDGKELILPPQCFHFDFNTERQLEQFGAYAVDLSQGKTGGLIGAFGYCYGIGKPLPFREGRPYKKSFRLRLVEALGSLLPKLSANK